LESLEESSLGISLVACFAWPCMVEEQQPFEELGRIEEQRIEELEELEELLVFLGESQLGQRLGCIEFGRPC